MKWVWRILGGIAALIVLAVAGLWLAGMRPGHGHNEASVEIARPVEKVWPWLSDDEKLKQWIHGLAEIRSLTPGVEEVGARMRVVVVLGSERTEAEMRMTAFEKFRTMGFDMESVGDPNNGFRSKVLYTIEENSGRTRVTLKEDSAYYGFLPRLFEPIITPSAQKLLEQNLASLKRLAEAEPAVSVQSKPEIERLKFYIGDWAYSEDYPKSALFPNGGRNFGTWTGRLGPAGNSVVNTFTSQGTAENYEGMEVVTWDPKEKMYRDFAFGGFPGHWELTARFEGEALAYRGNVEYDGKRIKFRSEVRPTQGGGFTMDEYASVDGGPEQLILRGKGKAK